MIDPETRPTGARDIPYDDIDFGVEHLMQNLLAIGIYVEMNKAAPEDIVALAKAQLGEYGGWEGVLKAREEERKKVNLGRTDPHNLKEILSVLGYPLPDKAPGNLVGPEV